MDIHTSIHIYQRQIIHTEKKENIEQQHSTTKPHLYSASTRQFFSSTLQRETTSKEGEKDKLKHLADD